MIPYSSTAFGLVHSVAHLIFFFFLLFLSHAGPVAFGLWPNSRPSQGPTSFFLLSTEATPHSAAPSVGFESPSHSPQATSATGEKTPHHLLFHFPHLNGVTPLLLPSNRRLQVGSL
jgi:hypothetical protein